MSLFGSPVEMRLVLVMRCEMSNKQWSVSNEVRGEVDIAHRLCCVGVVVDVNELIRVCSLV